MATKPAASPAKKDPKVPSSVGKALKAKLDTAAQVAGKEGKDNSHKYSPGWKAPKTPALATDLLWQVQQRKKEAQAKLDAIEAEESDLKAWLIETLPKSDASGVAGKFCRVTVVRKEVPRVADWTKLYANIVSRYQAHVRRKDGQQDGAFALLQRRLGEGAVKEAWANGEGIEGVEKFTAVTLSINKL